MKDNSNLKWRFDFLLSDSFKVSITFMIGIIAILLYVYNPTRVRALCVEAVAFTVAGNLIHLNYKNLPGLIGNGKQYYFGMGCLIVGHLIYRACFAEALGYSYLPMYANNAGGAISVFIFCASSIIVLYFISKESNVSILISFGYMIAVFFNANAIYTCGSLIGGRYILSSIGITLVLISELLIFVEKTACESETLKRAVWLIYPMGQFLIIVCA